MSDFNSRNKDRHAYKWVPWSAASDSEQNILSWLSNIREREVGNNWLDLDRSGVADCSPTFCIQRKGVHFQALRLECNTTNNNAHDSHEANSGKMSGYIRASVLLIYNEVHNGIDETSANKYWTADTIQCCGEDSNHRSEKIRSSCSVF